VQEQSVLEVSDPPTKKRKRALKKEEQPLPHPFQLPDNYCKVVRDGLDSTVMSGKARTKFIASIASAMFCYKQHPTKVEYRHVAHQIVQKYPFMGQQDNLVSFM